MSQRQALSFLSAANSDYIADMYARFSKNPHSVDHSWAEIFNALGDDVAGILQDLNGASWTPDVDKLSAVLSSNVVALDVEEQKPKSPQVAASKDTSTSALDAFRVAALMRAYRLHGHLEADLDPLKLMNRKGHADLDPKTYGFTDADMKRQVFVGGFKGGEMANLGQLLQDLKETYCGTIGIEYMHIQDAEQRNWLMERIEGGANAPVFGADEKKYFLKRLTAAEGFEKFLDVKYTGAKRFGVEGGDVTIPAIEQMIATCAQMGLEEMVLGMAHRGRLNVLTNVMGKSFTAMFSEFQGNPATPDGVQGSGDVKYHLGTSSDRDFNGHMVHMSLTPNPSHLEFVAPVAVGKTRAKQAQRNDKDGTKVGALIIHGDAAVAGQGIVTEILMMSELPGYEIGGSIHVVINNQIGFTTAPQYSRSGQYCTDVAMMIQSPVFHVNGDDVDAVMYVSQLAAEFRQTFKRDVFVDIVCYRRHGHNEGDEPSFTQPQMYKVIREKRTCRDLYAEKLISAGVVSQGDSDAMYEKLNAHLEKEFAVAENYKPNSADMLEGHWSGLKTSWDEEDHRGKSGVSKENLLKIGKALTTVPDGFDLNSKIARQLKAKADMFETGQDFDWATAEAMAFGSLAMEGNPVRLSGQDCGRGTFSQRHSVWTDQVTEEKYFPLLNITPDQAKFEVHDSPLSEAAVLGFEYGYSTSDPKSLVLWEGQFGDFVNGAQVIIDQFISSAETKWLRMSGLVMLLPHGWEGQGPEHSSARLERFLQACAEDNWQVVNCTTPANYFHALRRQLRRDYRKPLILMTPKSLLRHKLCVSPMPMFLESQTFHRVLFEDEDIAPPKKIKRVVLCSGKVYYDLLQERTDRGGKDVALIRLEQFYPFPNDILEEELARYPNAEIVWCQEEPENQGAWMFLDRRIEDVLIKIKHKATRPRYIGRKAAAAPATGNLKKHKIEQEALVNDALTV